ncbi:sphingosine hydroxylase [Cenococcum geophilum 1.58]|uniref:sphingosine hydroxylase n=1 Tax=Cenococcum geophilum 1.58 TaxID=794803 RepID=UPI00358E6941|nr:sphingosine hydroxylase [Cenococcum geophilum 1.58]
MTNSTIPYDLPPLPSYTLHPLPPLVSWIPDKYLTLALPIIAYWAVSMIFHMVDVYELFPQYRLHTPAELLKRNHVSRWDVFRDVIVQQIIQTLFGIGLAMIDEDATYGKEDYDIAVWAQRVRIAQRAIPIVLSTIGLDVGALAAKLSGSYPTAAGALAGGKYPWLVQLVTTGGQKRTVPRFAPWEMLVARAVYWMVFPVLQFLLGILVVDTWQYFLHRAMHMNRWLYVTFHSRHHRLYVPYAYGALYNHPFEGFLLDTLGTGLAYLVSGMTVRQSMWFFTCSTIKTVDDHCGYSLPFDPLQLITSNNAGYHDIHHQSWGIKSNFSQPFFTFWDRLLGTMWKGGDVSARYEKSRVHAQQKLDRDNSLEVPRSQSDSINSSASELDETTKKTSVSSRRSSRKKAAGATQQSGNLKGLRNRVNESLHGKGGNVLGVESSH